MDELDEDSKLQCYGNCNCCGDYLESYENGELDCGHLACNSCAYQKEDKVVCLNCRGNENV